MSPERKHRPGTDAGLMQGEIIMSNRTEKVELTVLCLLQDGNRILLQNRVKEDWKG